jgi:hypothetical protein
MSSVSVAKLRIVGLICTCQENGMSILYIANAFAQNMNAGIVSCHRGVVGFLVSPFSSCPHHFSAGASCPCARPSTTSFSAAIPPFHGSVNNPVDSVSQAEPGVSTTEASSVLSSSCMASSLEKEDRERLLPRAELDDEACRLRGGGFSIGSLCSKTVSAKLGDADSDPRLAKAVGGMRRRKDDCRDGGECGVESKCSLGVRIGDDEDRLDRLCPRRSLVGMPNRAPAAGREGRLARREGGMGTWTGRVGKCASDPRRRALS